MGYVECSLARCTGWTGHRVTERYIVLTFPYFFFFFKKKQHRVLKKCYNATHWKMCWETKTPTTIINMTEKKIGYDDAYSLKTPEDSIKLYKKWAQTYDQDFCI